MIRKRGKDMKKLYAAILAVMGAALLSGCSPDLDERDFVQDFCAGIKADKGIEEILSLEDNRLENVFWSYHSGQFEISVWTSRKVKGFRSISERIQKIEHEKSKDVKVKIKRVSLEWGIGKEPYRERVYRKDTLSFEH